MEENYQEYLFTPKCFEKDIKKIFQLLKTENNFGSKNSKINYRRTFYKGSGTNRIFEIEKKNSITLMTSIFSDLSPGIILEKLRDLNHLKFWFPYLTEINTTMKISQYCDILEVDVALPILNLFNILNQFQVIRYWSYNSEEHSYFLMFKTLNLRKYFDNLKSGGFIINVNPDLHTRSNTVRKSKYTSLIDNVYRAIGRNFCSSLENFIGSVKMHKYNLITLVNQGINQRSEDDDGELETVDAYRYLINYFSTVKIEEPLEGGNGSNKYKEINLKLPKKSILTELNENNLDIMKTYFEVKNEISSRYGENQSYFSDNEIIRFVVSITNNNSLMSNNLYESGNVKEKIVCALDELNNFRKHYKPNEFKFEELTHLNFDMQNFISFFTLDIMKRPVILIRLSYLNIIPTGTGTDPSNNSYSPLVYKIVRYILYTFNKAIDKMPSSVDKYIVLIDAKNAPNFVNCQLINENLKKLFQFFSKFYPERLSEIFIVNKGINFNSIWKGACSLIEELGEKNDKNKSILRKVKLINNIIEELSGIISEEKLYLI